MIRNWNKSGALGANLINIVSNNPAVLKERNDRFNLVGRSQANVSIREDVLVNGGVCWLVNVCQRVLVCYLAEGINKDLAGFLVEALGKWTLHEVFWADVLKAHAVDNQGIVLVFTVHLDRGALEVRVVVYFNSNFLEKSFTQSMSVWDLLEKLCSSQTDANSLVGIAFLDVAGCLNSSWTSTNDKN